LFILDIHADTCTQNTFVHARSEPKMIVKKIS